MGNSPSIEDAFRDCEDLAFRHYENFPVASILIPKDKRKYIAAIYAFARSADDFADEDGYAAVERLEKLAEMGGKLQAAGKGSAADPIFIALGETIERFQLPIRYFEQLLVAFRIDVEKKRYATWDELLHYCSHSANPIGRLVLHLFGYNTEERLRYSDAICTALQLTNFWQDLSIDIRKDRIYLPLEDLRRFQCTEEDIFSQTASDNFRHLLADEVTRTAQLFNEGKPLLKSVGGDLSFQLRVTWLGGRKILEKIQAVRYDVFHRRPTLSLWDKFVLGLRAWSLK